MNKIQIYLNACFYFSCFEFMTLNIIFLLLNNKNKNIKKIKNKKKLNLFKKCFKIYYYQTQVRIIS